MPEHPIESLMSITMENIHNMIDVDTIIGKPVETKQGSVIIPISKVNCGFAIGGGNNVVLNNDNSMRESNTDRDIFNGGTGAGVMLHPTAFLVVENGQIRLLPLDNNTALERLINIAPELIEQIKGFTSKDNSANTSSARTD